LYTKDGISAFSPDEKVNITCGFQFNNDDTLKALTYFYDAEWW
jgi:hypothetical protein